MRFSTIILYRTFMERVLQLKEYLIYIGLGVLCAAPSVVWTFCLKFRKKVYAIRFAALYIVLCVAITCFMGVGAGVIGGVVCGFFTYRNFQKYKEVTAQRNRENYKRIKAEERALTGTYDEKKAARVWPPVDNDLVDPEAMQEFLKKETSSWQDDSETTTKG